MTTKPRTLEEKPAEPVVALEEIGIPQTRETMLVGECIDARHPTLVGRVLVRTGDPSVPQWVPLVHGLSVREGDRVLLVQPANFAERVVVGVIDGFALRPRTPSSGPVLELAADEALRITTDRGEPLVEVARGNGGPVVRLLQPDVEIDLDGDLRVSARTLSLRARQGEARVEASADVVVRGENVHLN